MPVEIHFISEQLRRNCEQRDGAIAAWGARDAGIVRRRLDELRASRDVNEFLSLPHVRHRVAGDLLHVIISDRRFLVAAIDGGFAVRVGRLAQVTSITITGVKDGRAL